MINIDDFGCFLNILNNAKNYCILRVSDDEENKRNVLDRIMNDFNLDLSVYEETYEHIYWVYLELGNDDYDNVISKNVGRKFIKYDHVFHTLDNNNDTCYIFEFQRSLTDKRKRGRKSLELLELELEDAISKENYELAAKIKTKIDLKQKTNLNNNNKRK